MYLLKFLYTVASQIDFVQAASFGGSNIDPTAWEDKKCKGESRFPAQVKFAFIMFGFNFLECISRFVLATNYLFYCIPI